MRQEWIQGEFSNAHCAPWWLCYRAAAWLWSSVVFWHTDPATAVLETPHAFFAVGWCRWFTGGYYVTLEVLPLLAIIYALNNVAPKTNAPGSASETSPILGR